MMLGKRHGVDNAAAAADEMTIIATWERDDDMIFLGKHDATHRGHKDVGGDGVDETQLQQTT